VSGGVHFSVQKRTNFYFRTEQLQGMSLKMRFLQLAIVAARQVAALFLFKMGPVAYQQRQPKQSITYITVSESIYGTG
jgi:hypothetical protein